MDYKSQNTKTVLICCDNIFINEALKASLRTAGCDVYDFKIDKLVDKKFYYKILISSGSSKDLEKFLSKTNSFRSEKTIYIIEKILIKKWKISKTRVLCFWNKQ